MDAPFVVTNLDQLLTLNEAARWLRMNERDLSARSQGRNPSIPGIWINKRVVRFHPRAVLAKFANDAGVALEVVAAMFNLQVSISEAKQ
jgi:hypothetical protein